MGVGAQPCGVEPSARSEASVAETASRDAEGEATAARRDGPGGQEWVAIGNRLRPRQHANARCANGARASLRRAASLRRSVRSAHRRPSDHRPTNRLAPRDVKLAVGDLVVYGTHGIGRVGARRKQEILGATRDVVVLELEQLTVTLPLALARTQLRPIADEADLRSVGDALRADGVLNSRNWLSRRRETLDKLISGTPVELAQIVNEGAQRERLRSEGGGSRSQLSLSERQLSARARELLSGEIALALDLQPAAAESWIDGHLVRPSSLAFDGIAAQ